MGRVTCGVEVDEGAEEDCQVEGAVDERVPWLRGPVDGERYFEEQRKEPFLEGRSREERGEV